MCALNNGKISKEEMQDIRARYPEILERCKETPGCYIHSTDPRKTLETSPEDRQSFGKNCMQVQALVFGKVILTICLWIEKQMIWRVSLLQVKSGSGKDPVTAEKLIPKTMGLERGVFLWKPTTMKFITKITLNLLILTIRRLSALQKMGF